jgi:proteasome lid subunit RPN8/RPN11
MKKLFIPKHVYTEIVTSVLETREGLETGVTLFGTSLEGSDGGHIVLAVAGPGRRATHEPAHYSGDDSYANAVYTALRSAMPGISWIGELHVHPRGMTWLSNGDRRTVKEILTGNGDTLYPQEFVAGVMQRRNRAVDIYPYHFTREGLTGSAMELAVVHSDAPVVHEARLKGIENDRPCVCPEPERSREAVPKAPRHHWLRQRWERLRQHGRKSRDRQVHSR